MSELPPRSRSYQDRASKWCVQVSFLVRDPDTWLTTLRTAIKHWSHTYPQCLAVDIQPTIIFYNNKLRATIVNDVAARRQLVTRHRG